MAGKHTSEERDAMIRQHAEESARKAAEARKNPEFGRNRNCLTYWFPRLLEAGIPVPATEIIDAGPDWPDMLGVFAEGEKFTKEFTAACGAIGGLAEKIGQAIHRVGGIPAFLRTGQGSGKHQWNVCCNLQSDHPDDVFQHIVKLIEWSEMVNMLGLSWRYWCVREMLPVEPLAVLPLYGNMPLVPEVRAFIRDGQVWCHHLYWPERAIRDGLPPNPAVGGLSIDREADDVRERLARHLFDASESVYLRLDWLPLARQVAQTFAGDGSWSVDLLPTRRGWFVTDMAEAARSYHWPECPHAGSEVWR